ncbi:MAG TPA: 3'-5' exonuclease [Candidatus Omnitrophota bacterium]|nr:3'-5' exonuclease [Candidatus Omnitrophota bacterium]
MNARQTEYVVFDVETTGLSPQNGDRIVEIAAVRLRNWEIIDTFESLVNPERELPSEAQQIHHITEAMLAKAPTADHILPQIIDFTGGACLVGHNIKFDLNFLCYQLSLVGRKLRDETPAIDTLKMAKELLPHLTSFRLSHVAHSLGAAIKEAHRALPDVKVTAMVMKRLMDIAAEQDISTFRSLHKHFGVIKPNFKIEQKNHEFVF